MKKHATHYDDCGCKTMKLIGEINDLTIEYMQNYANAKRIIEWINDPKRKPAITAFTAGVERQIAYAIEGMKK